MSEGINEIPDLLSAEQLDHIAQLAEELGPTSDPSTIVDLLRTVPTSGVELALAVRDRYSPGDSTPYYLLGVLLESLVQVNNTDLS